MIFDIEYETMPREALEAIQLKRLQATLSHVYATVPFYKKKLDEAGILPGDIKSLEDLQRIPFTTKQDLRDNYPFGMLVISFIMLTDMDYSPAGSVFITVRKN